MARINPGRHLTKKELIIQKASALFRVRGFNTASMRDLAVAVGVEAPSLYNHIGSKTELLQAICFKIAGEFTAQLEKTENTNSTSLSKLEKIIRFHIHMMWEEFDAVFVANHDWKHLNEPSLSNFLNQRRNYEKKLVTLIETGIRQKEFKKANPYVTVLTILSAVRGLEFWLQHRKKFSPLELETDMVNHLLKGMIN